KCFSHRSRLQGDMGIAPDCSQVSMPDNNTADAVGRDQPLERRLVEAQVNGAAPLPLGSRKYPFAGERQRNRREQQSSSARPVHRSTRTRIPRVLVLLSGSTLMRMEGRYRSGVLIQPPPFIA